MHMMSKWRHYNQDQENPLDEVYKSLDQMYASLCRMPEECSTDVYYSQVRPYIFSYENIVYEGCSKEPMTYRGETGAQSSVIPAFQIALGVKHKDSMLTQHLKDMRKYMPPDHRKFLAALEASETNFREYAIKFGEKDLYNKCLGRLIDFRRKHLEYAVEYIQKKVENPTGTGGTPYIKWLSQLVQETEEFYL
jgi:indoleamine 2,3-dioxygenase